MKKHYCLSKTPPKFFNKLTDVVSRSWTTMGSIACNVNEINDKHYEIMFYPALREIYGGKDDGEVIFPGFHFNIGRFVRVFDSSPAPKVSFDSLRKDYIPHLMFNGYIDGIFTKIAVMESPPSGREAVERIYAIGPRKGQVEAKR